MRILFVCACLTPILIAHVSSAGLSPEDLRAHVFIDGVDYGYFEQIDELGTIASTSPSREVKKITLKRDFVTEPSLYLWAKNTMRARTDLKDLRVVMENQDGDEMSHFVLKFVQPLNWTLEAADPAIGGFHEEIDLAVQEISIH